MTPDANHIRDIMYNAAAPKKVFPFWSELPHAAARQSAVLVPLFLSENTVRILFLRRAENLSRHSGEYCFPGGMREVFDESPLQTALRETTEETGIPPEAVAPLLLLEPEHTVVSDVEVFPVLGIVRGIDPDISLCLPPSEIASACVVDMDFFPPAPRRKKIALPVENQLEESRSKIVSYPEYDLPDGAIVWGVTARILEKVCCLYRREK